MLRTRHRGPSHGYHAPVLVRAAEAPLRGTRSARRSTAALVALLLLGAGCGAGPAGSPEGAAVPELPAATEVGLSGSVLQYRSDIARRVLTVRVRAVEPLEVREVVVRGAGFEPGPTVPTGTRFEAGNSVDLKTTYGAARCDAPPSGASDAVVAVVHDGEPRRVRLELEDTYDLFAGLHEAECAERTVRRQVEFSFVGGWTQDGSLLRSTLRLRRLEGRGAVTVTELGDTTLLALHAGPPGGPVVVLDPQAAEVSVPFEVETVRCDPHALAESKRTTAFGMFVSIDGSVLVRLVVDPDPAGRERIIRFAAESCAARR